MTFLLPSTMTLSFPCYIRDLVASERIQALKVLNYPHYDTKSKEMQACGLNKNPPATNSRRIKTLQYNKALLKRWLKIALQVQINRLSNISRGFV